MGRALNLGLLLAAVSLASCRGGGSGSNAPVIDATTAPGAVTVVVRGAATIDFTGRPQVQFIRSTSDKVPENLRFLSVAIPQPQRAGTQQFRAGFNLYGYTGGSGAVVRAAPASPPPGLRSIAFFEIIGGAGRFDRPTKDCALTLENGARRGEIRCPALSDGAGRSASFVMTWDLP